jgi:hypothetical protein
MTSGDIGAAACLGVLGPSRQVASEELGDVAGALERWQGEQMMERLNWCDGWTDSGRVFSKENGTPLRDGWVSTRFASLAAADKIGSFIPERTPFESAMSHTERKMINEMNPATSPVRQSSWSVAEARGFEPRMGVNPNRISSAAP